MDQHVCDGPSHKSILLGTYFIYFKTRTHATKPMTDHRDNYGSSSIPIVGHLERVWRPLGEGSLTTMTVVQDEPSWVRRFVVDVRQRTLRKSWRSLGILSLTTITGVQDGPSFTYVRWWTLRENESWGVGINPMTVSRGHDGPSSGSHSVIQ